MRCRFLRVVKDLALKQTGYLDTPALLDCVVDAAEGTVAEVFAGSFHLGVSLHLLGRR